MPDIIEQLEKGKELLESGKINAKELKTKISSDEEKDMCNANSCNTDVNIGNNNNSGDNINNDNISDNMSDCTDKDENTSQEEKIEKYPGFDFSKTYTKGQVIYYVNVNKIIGEKELMDLKIRTVYPKMLVCCTEKSYTQCIGPDSADFIFLSRYEAIDCYNNTIVQQKVFEKYTGDDENE